MKLAVRNTVKLRALMALPGGGLWLFRVFLSLEQCLSLGSSDIDILSHVNIAARGSIKAFRSQSTVHKRPIAGQMANDGTDLIGAGDVAPETASETASTDTSPDVAKHRKEGVKELDWLWLNGNLPEVSTPSPTMPLYAMADQRANLLQLGFEVMVLDRKNTSVARRETIRHLENCKKYAEEHDAPCFLISIAIIPSSQDLGLQAAKVGRRAARRVSFPFIWWVCLSKSCES